MHSTHENTSGFTLIELLIVIAIIGILAAIAIPQFNQYKIRGYDTSAKQGLRDVALLCNAYWIDNGCSEPCSLPKIKDPAYGFNQDSGHDINLPSTSSQCSNFCASAKSGSSPNAYSIDGKALISSGSTCGGAGGSVQTASVSAQTQTFATYNSASAKEVCTEEEAKGPGQNHHLFAVVAQDGTVFNTRPVLGCDRQTVAWRINEWITGVDDRGYGRGKMVYISPTTYVVEDGPNSHWKHGDIEEEDLQHRQAWKYNFETGIVSNDQGQKFKNGVRVE